MKIIAAPDSFKGSLSAAQAARAIAEGALKAMPGAEIVELPLADGGEGTVDALVAATGGRFHTKTVTGPLGEPVEAKYGELGDGGTAVIEMAAAAGLGLVPANARNPMLTSTYGVGELILAARSHGFKRIIIGVGGSGTNDGGAGAMRALGVRFLDSAGRELPPGGAALKDLASIDTSGLRIPADELEILVACDVDNPLVGPKGASAVYGPQKGADAEMVSALDSSLRRYAEAIQSALGVDISLTPRGGAAGGLAAGLAAFLGADLRSGIEVVLDAVRFDDQIRAADLIITGEGRIDAQTLYGKTIMGVLRCASGRAPVVAIGGCIADGAEALYEEGLAGLFGITDQPMNQEDAMRRAPELISKNARAIVALFGSGKNAKG